MSHIPGLSPLPRIGESREPDYHLSQLGPRAIFCHVSRIEISQWRPIETFGRNVSFVDNVRKVEKIHVTRSFDSAGSIESGKSHSMMLPRTEKSVEKVFPVDERRNLVRITRSF